MATSPDTSRAALATSRATVARLLLMHCAIVGVGGTGTSVGVAGSRRSGRIALAAPSPRPAGASPEPHPSPGHVAVSGPST
ncbi:hypothetical protein NL676_039177 [Syzygium grande]|nr:hypothetical protein NL676_039177 [Syzygium grande]